MWRRRGRMQQRKKGEERCDAAHRETKGDEREGEMRKGSKRREEAPTPLSSRPSTPLPMDIPRYSTLFTARSVILHPHSHMHSGETTLAKVRRGSESGCWIV